jgi:hypothetical protein
MDSMKCRVACRMSLSALDLPGPLFGGRMVSQVWDAFYHNKKIVLLLQLFQDLF